MRTMPLIMLGIAWLQACGSGGGTDGGGVGGADGAGETDGGVGEADLGPDADSGADAAAPGECVIVAEEFRGADLLERRTYLDDRRPHTAPTGTDRPQTGHPEELAYEDLTYPLRHSLVRVRETMRDSGQRIAYEYDDHGHLVSADFDGSGREGGEAPNGVTDWRQLFALTHDDAGRVVTRDVCYLGCADVNGTPLPPDQCGEPRCARGPQEDEGRRHSFTYDASGRVLEETYGWTDGTVSWRRTNTFDGDGRAVTEAYDQPVDGVVDQRVTYTYEAGGERVVEALDGDYRPEQPEPPDDVVDERVVRIYRDGRLAEEGFDGNYDYPADGTVDWVRTYAYDERGALTGRFVDGDRFFGDESTHDAPDGFPEGVTAYRYDGAGRLVGETHGDGMGNVRLTTTYVYSCPP